MITKTKKPTKPIPCELSNYPVAGSGEMSNQVLNDLIVFDEFVTMSDWQEDDVSGSQ